MRRLLSTAVRVKAAPTEAERTAAILGGSPLKAYQPTDAEIRDAMARCTRELDDMVLARTAGGAAWEPDMASLSYDVSVTAEGEVALRGSVIIERPD